MEKTTEQVTQFAAYGFRDFKIKISGNIESDNDKLAIISQHVPQDLRLRFVSYLTKNQANIKPYIFRVTSSLGLC